MFESFLGSAGAAAGTQAIKSAWSKLDQEDDEELGVEQLVALGVLKSQSERFPEVGDLGDATRWFAEDFEVLRYAGVPGEKAFDLTRLIYTPRVYLGKLEGFDEEVAARLDDEETEMIVENALTGYFGYLDLSVEDDLRFEIAAVEKAARDSENMDMVEISSLEFSE